MKIRLPDTWGAAPAAAASEPPSANFAVTARIRGPLSLDRLQAALERLGRRHPLMGARIARDDQGAFLTSEGGPPVGVRVVERQRADDWVGEVEREIVRPSDVLAGPLLRVVWVRGTPQSELILVCDHMAADGRAGIAALRDLLLLLADPALELAPLEPPALRDVVPPAALALAEALCQPAGQSEPAGDGWFNSAPAAHPLRVIPISLDVAQTGELALRCRLEGVTVQAALCAAFLIPYAEEQATAVRRVEVPVDLRRRLTADLSDHYLSVISLAIFAVDCAGDPWTVARRAGAALAAALTDEDLFTFPWVAMQLTGRMPAGRSFAMDYDLSISNLGLVTIPAEYGALRLEAIYAPTMNVMMAGHRILGVTTFAGQMRCTFTSRDPQAPAVAERALAVLGQMIAASSVLD